MHYVKAIWWVLLITGLWIISHFVAVILGLSIAVYGIATIIKMERNND